MGNLDHKGRCCGRKPIEYKSGVTTPEGFPHKFCDRCDRSYDIDTGQQIVNWAWGKNAAGQWIRRVA